MKFSALLSAIGIAPKNLEQARAVIDPAKATLDSVGAMFAAAGLNLEQMLEAGPDSLKAHLASLDQSEAISQLTTKLATAEAGVTDLTAQLATEKSDHAVTAAALKAHAELLASTGFKADSDAKPEQLKAAFATHVEQAAAALLAKDGRPAVAHLSPGATEDAKSAAPLTDAEHLAKWEAMKAGSPERAAYAAANFDALNRAIAKQKSGS